MPTVSVIIPTYNRPKFLERSLQSVYKQTFKDFEVIIVDDGSVCRADNEKIVDKYVRKGMKIKYFYQKNIGAPGARNRGIKEAEGKYIAFLDDDDEFLPEKLERQVRLFEISSEKVGLIYTWAKEVDEKGNLLRKHCISVRGNSLKEILKRNFIPSPSAMVRKECFDKVGLFDENFPSCQDWEMWTRIASWYEFDVVEDFLVIYHKHFNFSIGKSRNALYGYYAYFKKYQNLYLQLGMKSELSNYLGWLAYKMAIMGDKQKAQAVSYTHLTLPTN